MAQTSGTGETAGGESGPLPEGGSDRGARAMTRTAIVLVVAGVLAMVLPGLLRDGVCGLITCADVTPDVAVGRPGGSELAVAIPPDAAPELQSLRLFPITGTATQDTPGAWIVYRTDEEATPTVVELGEEPEGFSTRIELTEEPGAGLWVLEASFGCASTMIRFAPEELDPGFVTEGDQPVPIGEWEDTARSGLRCAGEAPGWQRILFVLGALAASAGAVLGIVVVFRRPVSEDDWYDEDAGRV